VNWRIQTLLGVQTDKAICRAERGPVRRILKIQNVVVTLATTWLSIVFGRPIA
jgi:hypothetical protein